MLVTGKFGTRNAAKVATNEQQSVIIKLLSDHRNFDNEQVVMFYNIIAEQMSWTQITVETIRRYRRKYALLTSAGRLGDTEFRNRLAMQVKRRRPKFPLYMWSLDGWVCELLFQEYADGATTYHNRLVVEVVLDPCVNYPIGYAIGRQEDTALIKAALKDAVNHTAELFGRRYRAHQVQSDRFAIKKMTPFTRLSVRNTPRPKSAMRNRSLSSAISSRSTSAMGSYSRIGRGSASPRIKRSSRMRMR